MKKFTCSLFLAFGILLLFTGCETVKPYQRVYLHDQEMKMGLRGSKMFEDNMHAYREGAIGGGGKKSSGGCGCN